MYLGLSLEEFTDESENKSTYRYFFFRYLANHVSLLFKNKLGDKCSLDLCVCIYIYMISSKFRKITYDSFRRLYIYKP